MTPMGLTSRAVQPNRRSGWRTTAVCRASRQGGSGARPAARHEASERTDQAGRGAGRGKDAVSHGCTRDGSAPISSSTARARPHQVVAPPPAACRVPGGAAERARASRPSARSPAQVGEPCWSSTTVEGVALAGEPGDRADEVRPGGAVDPRGPDDLVGAGQGRAHPLLPRELAAGVDALRGRRGRPAPGAGARRRAAAPGRSRWRRGPGPRRPRRTPPRAGRAPRRSRPRRRRPPRDRSRRGPPR